MYFPLNSHHHSSNRLVLCIKFKKSESDMYPRTISQHFPNTCNVVSSFPLHPGHIGFPINLMLQRSFLKRQCPFKSSVSSLSLILLILSISFAPAKEYLKFPSLEPALVLKSSILLVLFEPTFPESTLRHYYECQKLALVLKGIFLIIFCKFICTTQLCWCLPVHLAIVNNPK